MKQHKWHKEIKAWADGLTIQYKDENFPDWIDILYPDWDTKSYIEFRIKPQPKEPQYLHAFHTPQGLVIRNAPFSDDNDEYIGKIKLEVEE
jgi:hypothetical protein